MLMVQDLEFTFKSTVTGATPVQCAFRVEQNGISLPCEIDVLPHEMDTSTKRHPLCVHASRLPQLVSVHASRSFQLVSHLFQTGLVLDNIDHCTRLVVVTRHCVRQLFQTFPRNVLHVILTENFLNFASASGDTIPQCSASAELRLTLPFVRLIVASCFQRV